MVPSGSAASPDADLLPQRRDHRPEVGGVVPGPKRGPARRHDDRSAHRIAGAGGGACAGRPAAPCGQSLGDCRRQAGLWGRTAVGRGSRFRCPGQAGSMDGPVRVSPDPRAPAARGLYGVKGVDFIQPNSMSGSRSVNSAMFTPSRGACAKMRAVLSSEVPPFPAGEDCDAPFGTAQATCTGAAAMSGPSASPAPTICDRSETARRGPNVGDVTVSVLPGY